MEVEQLVFHISSNKPIRVERLPTISNETDFDFNNSFAALGLRLFEKERCGK